MTKKKAVILMSGGVDSTTVTAIAKSQGFEIYGLTVAYGQRNHVELAAVARVVRALNVAQHKIIDIDLRAIGGSALTDDIAVPHPEDIFEKSTPPTYVPARNTIFLSAALGYAEVVGAFDIFYGANLIDYNAYVDCRPEFLHAFEQLANIATAAAVEGKGGFKIHAPLMTLDKTETIKLGHSLGVDYGMTHSCYDPSEKGEACGKCLSCQHRREGFLQAGLSDPTCYYQEVESA